MTDALLINRDISWLHFNERVLNEAGNSAVPLMERFRFLSIFSSNLDEFYRVRMQAVNQLEQQETAQEINQLINQLQERFGEIYRELVPLLAGHDIFLHQGVIPGKVRENISNYFFNHVLAFIRPVFLAQEDKSISPRNNQLSILANLLDTNGRQVLSVLNIPSAELGRFYSVSWQYEKHIFFLDDIIKHHLPDIFPGYKVLGAYGFKITLDAELTLEENFEGDLTIKLEEEIIKREQRPATRLLYEPATPADILNKIVTGFKLSGANIVSGGVYHNLKDLAMLPVKNEELIYEPWPPAAYHVSGSRLLKDVEEKDRIIHTPYQSYETVLRFFNEASIDPEVEEIYVTLYRVADSSQVVQSLISAAHNGKKVFVVVELKARFDETNNIKWARLLKQAGVKVIYSIPSLKVHAKIGLIKKKDLMLGLLATGNMNETTAKFYTDHILLTAKQSLLLEMEQLFQFLIKGHKRDAFNYIEFNELIVAQFNLQEKFTALINQEIYHARSGYPAAITIKMNNLEEKGMISQLYAAAEAGVKVNLIIRGICRLNPAVNPNISVRRIVDRFLEHGRVFIFYNKGDEQVFLGSSDWMQRNIFRRVEVCFPVYDKAIQQEILTLINIQMRDNTQAVALDEFGCNRPVPISGEPVRSQFAIYHHLKDASYAALV